MVGSEPSPPQKKYVDLLSLSGKGNNILLVIKHNKGAAKNNVTLTINNSIQKWAEFSLVFTAVSSEADLNRWYMHIFLSFASFTFSLFVTAVFCFLSLLQLKKTKKTISEALFFSLTVLLSGCRSVPQHHLLQPAVRENQRHARGGLSSSSSSRPPWRYPQDAQWLWHPGWGAGPQALRLAASLCLLFKYALSMQATEKPVCFAFFWKKENHTHSLNNWRANSSTL